MSSLVNRKSYEKEDLIKALIDFRNDHGVNFPTKKDWEAGKIKPSMRTFHRKFESLENAVMEAGKFKSVSDYDNHLYEEEQVREVKKYKRKFKNKNSPTERNDEDIPKHKNRRCTANQRSGFPCPFCGGNVSYKTEYHSSLATILIGRFVDLLNSNNGPDYSCAVMDCVFKVFGPVNPIMRKEMESAGYLEKYDREFNFLSEEEQ